MYIGVGDDAALRQAGVGNRASQAEVGDLDALLSAFFKKDVARFDVAMDQAILMCR